MLHYREVYSGAEYVLHYKCSKIINVVWVTMMYGAGLPLLFPIAAFNLFNQYICERISVAYLKCLPAAIDDRLTNNVIRKCKLAPLLLLTNGYWMISNPEIFANKWAYIDTVLDRHMNTEHHVSFELNWAFPLLAVSLASLFIFAVYILFGELLLSFGYHHQS